MRKPTDLNKPEPPDRLHVQLTFQGEMAAKIKALMRKGDMEATAVVRMLVLEGLEARDRRASS